MECTDLWSAATSSNGIPSSRNPRRDRQVVVVIDVGRRRKALSMPIRQQKPRRAVVENLALSQYQKMAGLARGAKKFDVT